MALQFSLTVATNGRGMKNITAEIADFVTRSNLQIGTCHIFIHHTSASLLICENADPLVQEDLERFMTKITPDGDKIYEHIDEGPDDMPAHVRTVLTNTFLVLPITGNKLALGRWQGIYLWEHRFKSHERHLTITLQD